MDRDQTPAVMTGTATCTAYTELSNPVDDQIMVSTDASPLVLDALRGQL
jgi:hypothetical protein